MVMYVRLSVLVFRQTLELHIFFYLNSCCKLQPLKSIQTLMEGFCNCIELLICLDAVRVKLSPKSCFHLFLNKTKNIHDKGEIYGNMQNKCFTTGRNVLHESQTYLKVMQLCL